ncbi:MAG: DnaJ domain-containing protein, partial [Candidatus Colwellbacteria bacterium]|nr:DnaJ domain-containing protein [Candidatus Colwellbacteria bacterium]
DYYKILGIERGASEDDIKKAYRKLAHRYHPDRGTGDEAMFKKVNEAYRVLANGEKRKQYDRFGRTFEGGSAAGAGGPFGGFGPGGFEFNFDASSFEDLGNISDVFDAFFEGVGVRRRRRSYQQGSDLELTEEITLEEAFTGARKSIAYRTYAPCRECSGVGHFPKQGFETCAVCNGRGEVQESRQTFFGNFASVKVCEKCRGLGRIPNKLCGKCSATGRIAQEKTINVDLAPGIGDSQVIKLTGAGEAGVRGAGAGDLYVRVRVAPHERFTRDGDNLITRQSVDIVSLLLTREIEVASLDGKRLTVGIPAGAKVGERITVTGAGMPRLGHFGKGDLFVILGLQMPRKITKKGEELLRKLKDEIE